jgi:hypothetical protein
MKTIKNRELLNAIEAFIVEKKLRLISETESGEDVGVTSSILNKELVDAKMEDVKDIFSDLNDYWDTLEVGK